MVWNIQAAQSELGNNLCDNLPFIHSLLGYDTTSQLFGIGKQKALHMMKAAKTNSPLLIAAQIFNNSTSSPDDAAAVGEKALGAIYGDNETNSINTLRYRTFINKVAKNTVSVKAQSLPPSAATTKFHSLRVYFQVQMWRGNTSFNPCEWGW